NHRPRPTRNLPMPVPTHFVVLLNNWRRVEGGKEAGYYHRLPGEKRIGAFAVEEDAMAEATRLEAEGRRLVNPFKCGLTWADRSTWRNGASAVSPGNTGMGPRLGKPANWAGWGEKKGQRLPAEKLAVVWEGLSRLRFYTVVERPIRPVGYAIIEVTWQYNDE